MACVPGYGVEVGPCLPAKTRRWYLNRAKYAAISHSGAVELWNGGMGGSREVPVLWSVVSVVECC